MVDRMIYRWKLAIGRVQEKF